MCSKALPAALCLLMLAACAHGPSNTAACSPGWRLEYHHDQHGTRISGSRQALFNAIRRGYPVRLAWGRSTAETPPRTVEHAAEPVFVTITNNQHAFAQLPEHIAQESYWAAEKSRFGPSSVMWRGLIGTDGHFDAVWTDRATGETIRHAPQTVSAAWYSLSPATGCSEPEPAPLAAPIPR